MTDDPSIASNHEPMNIWATGGEPTNLLSTSSKPGSRTVWLWSTPSLCACWLFFPSACGDARAAEQLLSHMPTLEAAAPQSSYVRHYAAGTTAKILLWQQRHPRHRTLLAWREPGGSNLLLQCLLRDFGPRLSSLSCWPCWRTPYIACQHAVRSDIWNRCAAASWSCSIHPAYRLGSTLHTHRSHIVPT